MAVWPMLGIWPVVEATVGERSAQALMEEQEEQCDLNPFGGEKVGITRAVALEESVPLQFAQIVAKLVEAEASAERWKLVSPDFSRCLVERCVGLISSALQP